MEFNKDAIRAQALRDFVVKTATKTAGQFHMSMPAFLKSGTSPNALMLFKMGRDDWS